MSEGSGMAPTAGFIRHAPFPLGSTSLTTDVRQPRRRTTPSMDWDVCFKEPKGLLKAIEVVVSVFALFTCLGSGTSVVWSAICRGDDGDKTVYRTTAGYWYPYKMDTVFINMSSCSPTTLPVSFALGSDHSTSAQLHTALCCLSAVYGAAVFVLYGRRLRDSWFLKLDVVLTVLLACVLFVGAAVWSSTVQGIKDDVSPSRLRSAVPWCSATTDLGSECGFTKAPHHNTANVSCIFAFLNAAVFAANVWFVFKETPWYSEAVARRQKMTSGQLPLRVSYAEGFHYVGQDGMEAQPAPKY